MEFWKTIHNLVRRLYVGPPLITISIAAASLVSHFVPLQYQSSAFVVLTSPTSGGSYLRNPAEPVGLTNPLLQFNDGLKTTASILIHSVNTPAAMRDLGAPVEGPARLIVDDGRSNADLLGSSGPFIYIEAESRSASDAKAMVAVAERHIRSELVRRQEELDVPQSTFITIVDVVPPSPPEPVLTDKLEAGGLVLALGLGLGFGGAYLVERRRIRRRYERPPEEHPTRDVARGIPSLPESHEQPGVVAHTEANSESVRNGAVSGSTRAYKMAESASE